MKKSSTKYDVLSPDGFSIDAVETYSSPKEARDAFNDWKKRYEQQGYYSSMNYGRIPLTELKHYIKIVKL
jgi:hypothetical protein